MSNKIKYSEIIALGFEVTQTDDSVYFNEYGYKYEIIMFQLSKTLYLDWEKHSQICYLVRTDKKGINIKKKYVAKGLKELKNIVEFFKD